LYVSATTRPRTWRSGRLFIARSARGRLYDAIGRLLARSEGMAARCQRE